MQTDSIYKIIISCPIVLRSGKCCLIMGSVCALHTGHGNEDAQYTMGGTVLNTIVKEKALLVLI